MARIPYIAALIVLSFQAFAAGEVPFSVKYIKPAAAGFVELVGPGKIQVNGETLAYEGTQFIATKNISAMTSSSAFSRTCMLHYASEGYTENITVSTQTCGEIISIMSVVNK